MLSLEEDLSLGGCLHSVVGLQAIYVHPLQSSVGRQQFAVMESSSRLNKIISGGSHHRSFTSHSCLIFVLNIIHISPDPERTSIVRTLIISSNEFLTKLVISRFGFCRCVLVSPIDGFLINISASVSNFIMLVEVKIL